VKTTERKAGLAVNKRHIAIAVTAVGIGASAVAYAAIPDAKGIIHGCRNPSGLLRVIDSGQTCSSAETALDWVQSAGYEVFTSSGFQAPTEITAITPAWTHVLTLSLGPGSYQVSTFVDTQKDSGDSVLVCATLTAPDYATSVERAAMGTDPGDSRWLTMAGTGLIDLPQGGQAELACRQRPGATGPNPFVVESDISAVRIGTVTQGVGS
jgi:hypothetical protein